MYDKYINVLTVYSNKAKSWDKKDLIDMIILKMNNKKK
jgi:hypothetical protein